MAKKIKDKERDSIDFGKSRIDPLFNSIFYPTLLSMVFASFFTVADGIFVGQGVGSNALAAINIPGCICIIIQMIGTFVIRLDGSPKFAASLEIFPGLLNIFLDWLFVFPMQMGIAGSGIASSISCAAAAGMVIWYMFFRSKTVKIFRLKLSLTSFYLTARNVGYMVRSGFSSMLGELAMSTMLLTGNYVFIRELGEDGVAAFSVACYLYPIVFMINNSVAESAQPIISFNHGAGNRYRVRRAFRVSLSTATICGVLATTFLTLLAKPLVGLFLQAGTNAYEVAIAGLPLFSYSAIFFAMNVAIIGYYQSTEQNMRATLCMLFRGLIFLVPAFITMPMFISPQGMWLAVPVTECMTLGVILLTDKGIISR